MNLKPIRFGSICSGIEAATVAWAPLNWYPQWYAEVDPFCRDLLSHHYPQTYCYLDLNDITESISGDPDNAPEPIDLLVGGTPCQAFSVAGGRAGLDDPRGDVTLQWLRLVRAIKPRWLVWENVPGVLSIDGGRTFGTILGTLGDLGYGVAYRVLDAQHFGVPQRRRRVFLVGHIGGEWRRAAAVLFEAPGVQRDIRSSKGKGKDAAGRLDECSENGSYGGLSHTIPILEAGARTGKSTTDPRAGIGIGQPGDPMFTLQSSKQHAVAFNLRGRDGGSQPEAAPGNVASLRASQGGSSNSYIAFDPTQVTSPTNRSNPQPGDPCHTMPTQGRPPHIAGQVGVRRITPMEAERLQGFPDGYTLIPGPNGKPPADGPRYRALGNSFAVPVVRWIGKRIQMMEDLINAGLV